MTIDNAGSTLIMSDSLKGMIPELEEDQLKTFSDSFIIATIEITSGKDVDVIAGSLTGASFEKLEELKLDVRVNLREAYDIVKKFKATGLSCRVLYLHCGDDEISFEGPYKVSSTKIMEFDRQLKMCTLGFDLIKP